MPANGTSVESNSRKDECVVIRCPEGQPASEGFVEAHGLREYCEDVREGHQEMFPDEPEYIVKTQAFAETHGMPPRGGPIAQVFAQQFDHPV